MKRNRKWKIPHSFEKRNLAPQPIKKSQIKSETLMKWRSQIKKGYFLYRLFCTKAIFLRFVFFFQCIVNRLSEYTKNITSYTFVACFLKLTKAFSVSLSHFNLTWSFSANRWNSAIFFSDLKCFYCFLFHHA